MEFALDRWITKHNAWIDVFVPNYMRWIFHDVKMTILFLGSFSLVKCCRCYIESIVKCHYASLNPVANGKVTRL